MNKQNSRLTRSAAWRADFNRRRLIENFRRKKRGLPSIKTLMAGYTAHRWNISAERWNRMYEAREVSFCGVFLYLISSFITHLIPCLAWFKIIDAMMKAELTLALSKKKKKNVSVSKSTSEASKSKWSKAMGHFGGQVFTVADWASLKEVIDEIMVSLKPSMISYLLSFSINLYLSLHLC